ncbi:MAG: hypothetical protein QXD57_07685 [Ignisphaera sp.]
MATEDWKTYAKPIETEIKKDIRDEVHEFLTKVFNVYMVKMPPHMFRQLEIVRDKLIVLTSRFSNEYYEDLCDTFSKIYRLIVLDKDVPEDVKKLVKELSEKTNSFFSSKGMHICVKELKYYNLKIKVLFNSSPLKDANVILEAEGRVVASSKTDDNGICVVEVPEGKYSVYTYKYVKEGEYVYEEKTLFIPTELEVVFNVTETKSASEIARERGGRPLIREVTESK